MQDPQGEVSGVTTIINYSYDVAGNRISKAVKVGSATPTTTWYVRDASGNVMSIYADKDNNVNGGALSQMEIPIYGSSRLGELNPRALAANMEVSLTPATNGSLTDGTNYYLATFTRGLKLFELSNHFRQCTGNSNR